MDVAPAPSPAPLPGTANEVPLPGTAAVSAPRPRSNGPIIAALVVALVALLGGGAWFAVVKGYVSLPFGAKPPSVDEIVESMGSIRSARIGAEFGIDVGPREADVEPISIESGEAPESEAGPGSDDVLLGILAAAPGDLAVKMSVISDWVREKEKAEGETVITGTYSSSGLTIAFDLAVRNVGGDTYLKIDKLPIPLIDLSSIAGIWIRSPGELGQSMMTPSGNGSADENVTVFAPADEEPAGTADKEKSDVMEELSVDLIESIRSGALAVSAADANADVDGRPAWKFSLTVDPDKRRAMIRRIYEEREQRFPDIEKFEIFDDQAIKELDDAKFQAQSDAIVRRLKIDLFVDKKTRMPSKFAFRLPLAPDEKISPKLAGKQFNVSATITLEKINEPTVIEAPAGALTPRQAMNRMLGRSDEDALLEDQMSVVGDLYEAILGYQEKNGRYPASLQELVGYIHDPFAAFGSEDGKQSSFAKKVINIPTDRFTGQPFPYVVTEDGFELKYEMRIPADSKVLSSDDYVEGINTMVPDDISREGGRPPSDVDETSTLTPGGIDLGLRFAESIDGSDQFDIPAPGQETRQDLDTDGDGLTDAEEQDLHGTDPLLADTDGDGFSDKQEIDGGYDPLTNAKTGERVGE